MEDLLGSFDLKPAIKPLSMTHTSSRGGRFQEVEVPLYDSDSLPSPPSSDDDSSNADLHELDQLLDFSRDDEFNYNPAFAKKRVPSSQEEMEAPRIMKATLQAQHGMEVCVCVCTCVCMCVHMCMYVCT